jgi:hypothetical protein
MFWVQYLWSDTEADGRYDVLKKYTFEMDSGFMKTGLVIKKLTVDCSQTRRQHTSRISILQENKLKIEILWPQE